MNDVPVCMIQLDFDQGIGRYSIPTYFIHKPEVNYKHREFSLI